MKNVITYNHTNKYDVRPTYVYANVANNMIFNHVFNISYVDQNLIKTIWSNNQVKEITINNTTYKKNYEVVQYTTTTTIFDEKFTEMNSVAYFTTEEEAKEHAYSYNQNSNYIINKIN